MREWRDTDEGQAAIKASKAEYEKNKKANENNNNTSNRRANVSATKAEKKKKRKYERDVKKEADKRIKATIASMTKEDDEMNAQRTQMSSLIKEELNKRGNGNNNNRNNNANVSTVDVEETQRQAAVRFAKIMGAKRGNNRRSN